MKPERMADLVRITKLKFQIEYEAVKAVLEEEAHVRADLSRLDDQTAAANQRENSDHAMEIVGANILWQKWIARARRNLNIELASILARKPHAMERVRMAFGRHQATEELLRKSERQCLKRKAARQNDFASGR